MTPRERLFALEQFGIKLGLDNILVILGALQQPQQAWPSIHVAGTNGKGSVVAMVERGLRAAGYRTGRYISPHLNDIEERIAIDGQPIDSRTFDSAADDLLQVVDQLRATGALTTVPTFFEVTTAMAFAIFRRRAVDVAVIEVGLGGRFDATNVLTPMVSVITSIAFDHERHLGSTLAAIAREKAGIIKPGVPVVVGPLPAEAAAVITAAATSAGAPLIITEVDAFGHGPVALRGQHQTANAAIAARTLEVAGAHGFAIDKAHVATALSDVDWPGRLEWLRTADHRFVLIDAAHNPAGATALAAYISSETGAMPVVIALMKDKDVDAIVAALAPVATRFIATAVPFERCLPAIELATRIEALCPAMRVDHCAVPDDAVATVLDESGRTVVAGSIFLAGPLRARLLAQGAVRYPSDAALPFLP